MELLLLEDIPGVGQKNDIIVVKNGFALNNLLPRRRALIATPTVRRRYAEQIRNRAEERQHEVELSRSAAGVLQDAAITFTKKASKTGKLYAAISENEISEALSEQLSVEIPEVNVTIEEAIKSTGSHTARIKLADGQEADVKVEVVAE
ncbi:50S ribosomal protein L9 [Candidatus Peribacteria bacterium]|jgi:large subunit ribosomal protein L9|nr:50S ribosomal protein L9 [Candidatus Peribacteria bacterium]MBT4021479.1 50S ribosomal protein L9 [Candidatus Peribacteria bacterium]MBT4240389.1 50S ribosomal protein L9 [Candidatus Peribacteria bacterium]MBT4473812.1 50S ribosomal protein L9 [Candidatus Peribacteria bacterium]